MTTPVISLSDLNFRWGGHASFTLNVPDFTLIEGETVLLLGESGSGKSTLLSLICGTVLAQSGTVSLAGTDLSTLSNAGRDRFRAENIGVIFQQFNLLPFATVADNIQLPLSFAPKRRKRAGDAPREAARLCSALKLPPELINTNAARLSVGQQQRVAVARALIGRPPIIIADEPTSSLDAGTQTAFLDLMFNQIAESETSLLMVSHDPSLGERFDRVVALEDIATIQRQAA